MISSPDCKTQRRRPRSTRHRSPEGEDDPDVLLHRPERVRRRQRAAVHRGWSGSACTPLDGFLRSVVPEIEQSAAYKDNGLIAITFDEAPQSGPSADSARAATTRRIRTWRATDAGTPPLHDAAFRWATALATSRTSTTTAPHAPRRPTRATEHDARPPARTPARRPTRARARPPSSDHDHERTDDDHDPATTHRRRHPRLDDADNHAPRRRPPRRQRRPRPRRAHRRRPAAARSDCC